MSTPLSNTSPSGPALIAREAVPRHGAGAGQEVDARAATLCAATPMELVEAERQGVQGIYLKDLSRRLAVPTSRLYAILGVPKATAEKKAAAGEAITGAAGHAAIGLTRLLGMAQAIVADSTAAEAEGFDTAHWLGQWIEQPQPVLGGRRPSDLIGTPTGVDIVARLLGGLHSGAYQ